MIVAKFVITLNDIFVKEVAIIKAATTLVRMAYNDFIMDNQSASGEDAIVYLKNGKVQIHDRSSTNGTYVNGKRVTIEDLEYGDLIAIGKNSLCYYQDSYFREAEVNQAKVARASVRVLSGLSVGKELTLTKDVTTVGKTGLVGAAILRNRENYFFQCVEGKGALLLNGKAVGREPCLLQSGSQIELAGAVMGFFLM